MRIHLKKVQGRPFAGAGKLKMRDQRKGRGLAMHRRGGREQVQRGSMCWCVLDGVR